MVGCRVGNRDAVGPDGVGMRDESLVAPPAGVGEEIACAGDLGLQARKGEGIRFGQGLGEIELAGGVGPQPMINAGDEDGTELEFTGEPGDQVDKGLRVGAAACSHQYPRSRRHQPLQGGQGFVPQLAHRIAIDMNVQDCLVQPLFAMKSARIHSSSTALSAVLSVRVDRIGDEGLDVDEVIGTVWVDAALGQGSPFRANGAGRLIVHLEKVEHVVYMRGRAKVQLAGQCGRCLSPADLALNVPIEVALFPSGKEPAANTEGELAPDEMGVAAYEDGVINLSGIIHDEVFLELPMNPLCKESCAGLCPSCGTNLNETRCNCAKAVDPRWEILRDLKAN